VTLNEFVALASGLGVIIGAGVIIGVSAWVVLSRNVREGPRPVPPWWWERKGWDD
jgi:hypothetical protein